MTNKNPEHFLPPLQKTLKDPFPILAKDIKLIEKRQKQIAEAACRLFFQKGFHETTIREIAAESNMSMGKLYHYISSKEDILFLVTNHMQELWWDYLIDYGFEKTEDPLAKLIRAIRASIECAAKNKKLIQFVYSDSKHLGKEHLKIIMDTDNRIIDMFFRKLLEEVSKEYTINYDLELAARYITFITVFIALRGWNLKEWSLDTVIDFMTMFILKALGLPYDNGK